MTGTILFNVFMDVYGQLEKCIFIDPGKRGIERMWESGCLKRAATSIMETCRSKPSYVLTGFCCRGDTTETDGPLGSAVLCEMLRFVGFDTRLLTDRKSSPVVIACSDACPVFVTDDPAAVIDMSFIVSVERPARSAKSGRYLTMTARDISDVTAPLDTLFPVIGEPAKPYLTVAVGDGGNEVGTGNIAGLVETDVPNGSDICVAAGCDVLVMAGVSNWGALAIAAAIAVVVGTDDVRHKFSELADGQSARLAAMVGAGAYDGCTGKCEMSVDGMYFSREHMDVTERLKAVIMK